MKRLLLIIAMLVCLAGCAKEKFDDYSAYKGFSSDQLFDRAETAMVKHRWDQARKYLEALDALYPFGPYAEQGQLDIIYAYYMNGDGPSAVAAADRFVQLYPQDSRVAYAYYMKGVVSMELGLTWLQRSVGIDPAPLALDNKHDAFMAFNQVVVDYPNSPYAYDSMLRMRYIRNLFARKYLGIADYYLKRKAYVAAANRASYVLEHFDGSPQVIPALKIMATAYQRLGLTQLEANTRQVLNATMTGNSKS